MLPLVLLSVVSALSAPIADLVEEPAAVDVAGSGVATSTTVEAAGLAASTDDLGLLLTAALPGPGFSLDLDTRLDATLDGVLDLAPTQTESEGPAIPVRMPSPREVAVPSGLAILGAAAYAVARWRLIGPWFLLPLYSRLANGDLLKNEVRAKLHDVLTEHPGLSLQELCEASGAGWGTTVYHLQRLEQAGMITSKRQGHHRRFYVQGEVDRRDMAALGMLRNETPAKIARYLLEDPGCNQKDVCEALGISPSLAHKHLKRLEAENLVTTEREWRSVHYTPDPKLKELLAQAA